MSLGPVCPVEDRKPLVVYDPEWLNTTLKSLPALNDIYFTGDLLKEQSAQ